MVLVIVIVFKVVVVKVRCLFLSSVDQYQKSVKIVLLLISQDCPLFQSMSA